MKLFSDLNQDSFIDISAPNMSVRVERTKDDFIIYGPSIEMVDVDEEIVLMGVLAMNQFFLNAMGVFYCEEKKMLRFYERTKNVEDCNKIISKIRERCESFCGKFYDIFARQEKMGDEIIKELYDELLGHKTDDEEEHSIGHKGQTSCQDILEPILRADKKLSSIAQSDHIYDFITFDLGDDNLCLAQMDVGKQHLRLLCPLALLPLNVSRDFLRFLLTFCHPNVLPKHIKLSVSLDVSMAQLELILPIDGLDGQSFQDALRLVSHKQALLEQSIDESDFEVRHIEPHKKDSHDSLSAHEANIA